MAGPLNQFAQATYSVAFGAGQYCVQTDIMILSRHRAQALKNRKYVHRPPTYHIHCFSVAGVKSLQSRRTPIFLSAHISSHSRWRHRKTKTIQPKPKLVVVFESFCTVVRVTIISPTVRFVYPTVWRALSSRS